MYGGELDIGWEGGLEWSGWMKSGFRRDWAGVRPGKVVPVGSLSNKGVNHSTHYSILTFCLQHIYISL